MKTRPWPLTILAFLHFIGPLLNVFFSAHLLGIGVDTFMSSLWRQSSWFELISFYTFIPLAGFAIYKVREWSYPVFLAVMGWLLYSNYETWKHYPGVFNGTVMIGTFVINVGLVSYFLVPQVRAAYFNQVLRWWESAPRYLINVPGVLKGARGSRRVHVNNLSEGGLFIQSSRRLESGDVYTCSFSFFGAPYEIAGKVIHGRRVGYGIQFIHTADSLGQIQRLVHAMSLLGVECPSRALSEEDELGGWLKRLVTTGHGLVPEVGQRVAAAPGPKLVRTAKKRVSHRKVLAKPRARPKTSRKAA